MLPGKWLFSLLWPMFILLNGKYTAAGDPVLKPDNRAFRYGDGLFETMRFTNGQIRLWDLHTARLWKSLEWLGYSIPALFTPDALKQEITGLLAKNKQKGDARIRLTVFRGNGGLYDPGTGLQYLIESWPLERETGLNSNGLVTGIYPLARKSTDPLAGIKSASFLPYAMAALYAKENKLNDCFVLNTADTIADSTIANLFIRKGNRYSSPGPEQGAVDGVMRRYLIGRMREAGMEIYEEPVSAGQLSGADEVFLTNAVRGIRWVQRCGEAVYTPGQVTEIYRQFMQTIP